MDLKGTECEDVDLILAQDRDYGGEGTSVNIIMNLLIP
jgi:hypothetical protein